MSRLVLALLLAVAVTPVLAHHGISNWDLNKDVTVEGTISTFEFINPHSWLHVSVKGADGKPEEWKCEMRSANALRRSGWTVQMFQPGSKVVVTGSPERTKPRECYLSTIAFADGSHMDRYGQRQLAAGAQAKATAARAMRTADGRPNLAGDWAAEQRVMADPRGQKGNLIPLSEAAKLKPGEIPAGPAFPGARGTPASMASDPVKAAWDRPTPVTLTDAGRKALQTFNPASRDNPRLRCEPTNIIFDWAFDSVVNRIAQTPTAITLQIGHMDLARTIHLDQKTAPAGVKPSRAGYSVGRWEGDVLVVETTHFLPGVLNADSRILHGAGLRITERFELDATGRRLSRRFEAVDPEYFTDAWRGQDVVEVSDVPYAPYRCKDPGGAPASAAAR